MKKSVLIGFGSASVILAFFFSAGLYATTHENAQELLASNPAYALGGISVYWALFGIPGFVMIYMGLKKKQAPTLQNE
jgi:hypothetical protein